MAHQSTKIRVNVYNSPSRAAPSRSTLKLGRIWENAVSSVKGTNPEIAMCSSTSRAQNSLSLPLSASVNACTKERTSINRFEQYQSPKRLQDTVQKKNTSRWTYRDEIVRFDVVSFIWRGAFVVVRKSIELLDTEHLQVVIQHAVRAAPAGRFGRAETAKTTPYKAIASLRTQQACSEILRYVLH